MNIAIIGTGNVGRALGGRWVTRGHHVTYGVHDTAKATGGGSVSVAEAVASAEVVVLAIPWKAVPDVLASTGSLDGKIVIDCINAVKPDRSGLVVPPETSAAEQIAAKVPGASVFKTCNQSGAENMANGDAFRPAPVMFVAGDDGVKKPQVLQLVRDLGFEAVDAGALSAARMLEQLAMLWIHLAFAQNVGRDFAFALVRRDAVSK